MSAYSDYTDEELTALLRKGDHAAFTEIYRRYAKTLLDMVYKRLDSVEDSEELVQELFINLYRRREEIVINSSLEGYLKNALKYRVLNVFRTRVTRERYAAIIQKDTRFDDADPEMHLEAKQLAEQIRLATLKLPVKCREVFILSKVENLSNKSIAAQLGISVSAVEQHITKAMKLMRTYFKDFDQGLILVLLLLYYK